MLLSKLRSKTVAVVSVTAALLLSGCTYGGATTIPLPFREGAESDAKVVTVQLDEASGLTTNGEVKVDDVTVGSISDLRLDGWKPVATVRLNADVSLPSNAVARVGQKSLLGAKFIELAAPADAAEGELADGAVVKTATLGSYPQTEQVLASLSLVLNGGGLQQVRTITEELDKAMAGREPQVREFLERFEVFIASLDKQRGDILEAVGQLDRLAVTLDGSNALAHAIDDLPVALEQIENDRKSLVEAMDAVSRLGQTATTVINRSGDDTLANLEDLRPALAGLANAGSNLTQSLSVVPTFPFPGNTSFPYMFQGDYGNLFLTVDVSPDVLKHNLIDGFAPVDPSGSLLQAPPLGGGDGGGSGLSLPDLDEPDLGLPLLDSGSTSSSSGDGTSSLDPLVPGLLGRESTR